MGGESRVEVTQYHGVAYTAQHADEQPWKAGRSLAHDIVVRFYILR